MTILITGASGFVAHHFLKLLVARKQDAKIIAVYNTKEPAHTYMGLNIRWIQTNLNNKEQVQQLLLQHQPTHILHLAAQSSVAKSWSIPYQTFTDNTLLTLNLLDGLKETNSKARILLAGSAEVYAPSTNPINENYHIAFANTYALSKYTQEQLALLYKNNYGLNIVCTRAFNHIGPKQNTNFAIPSFAVQIMQQVKHGATQVNLEVGNTTIIRDFTDVRDIVAGYWLLLCNSTTQFIYNLCSGQGRSIDSIIQLMAQVQNVKIITTIDSTRVRPTDNPVMIGDASLLQQELHWQPVIAMEQTIEDILNSMG